MFHLIVDTASWVSTTISSHHLLAKLRNLMKKDRVKLIVPEVLKDEWARRKRDAVHERMKNFDRALEDSEPLYRFLDGDQVDGFLTTLEDLKNRRKDIEESIAEEVGQVDALLEHPNAIHVDVTDEIKLRVVGLAYDKVKPFKSMKDIADCLILVAALECIEQNELSNCIFVSKNTKEFGQHVLNHYGLEIVFERQLGRALNEIEPDTVSAEDVARMDERLEVESRLDILTRSVLREMMEESGVATTLASNMEAISRTLGERYFPRFDRLLESMIPNFAMTGVLADLVPPIEPLGRAVTQAFDLSMALDPPTIGEEE